VEAELLLIALTRREERREEDSTEKSSPRASWLDGAIKSSHVDFIVAEQQLRGRGERERHGCLPAQPSPSQLSLSLFLPSPVLLITAADSARITARGKEERGGAKRRIFALTRASAFDNGNSMKKLILAVKRAGQLGRRGGEGAHE